MVLAVAKMEGTCKCGHPFGLHTFEAMRCLHGRCRCRNMAARADLLKAFLKVLDESEWHRKLGQWWADRKRPAA
jgi:hypothetical protein